MTKAAVTIEPAQQEIVMTRVFEAPRDLVFKTYTDPDLIPRWWGPARLTTTVEVMEVKWGGRWRILQRDPDGHLHAFHGVYHEASPAERVVGTFEYEGEPGHVVLETATFEEVEGGTRLTTHSVFQSVEDRDGAVAAGMEGGMVESMDRLEVLLAST
jgi:uncharacterized protein YndB with AHSA1/START domain